MKPLNLISLLTIVVLVSMVVLVTACSSVNVGSDYNAAIDFSKFKTYSWHAPNEYNQKTSQFITDILDKRIRDNVDQQLQAKGYVKQDSGDVDFYVNYTVATDERVNINTYNTYSGVAPGYRYGYYGAGPYRYSGVVVAPQTQTTVHYYTQGTFLLDIIDVDSHKLVWRGSAEGRINKNAEQHEREEAAKEIIAEVLANFPPQ